jgi:hypothetical protein
LPSCGPAYRGVALRDVSGRLFNFPATRARGRIVSSGGPIFDNGGHHVGANSKSSAALDRLHRLRHEDGPNSCRAEGPSNRLHLPMPFEAPPRTRHPRTAEPAAHKPRWRVLEAFVVPDGGQPAKHISGPFLSHGRGFLKEREAGAADLQPANNPGGRGEMCPCPVPIEHRGTVAGSRRTGASLRKDAPA